MSAQTVISGAPEIDALLDQLTAGQNTWAATPLAGRRVLLERLHTLTGQHAQEWIDAAVSLKGLDPASPLVGEEWLSGPYSLLNGVAALIESVTALEAGRSPVDGFELGTAPGGRLKVTVLPHTIWDHLLLSGFSAEVWMPPGVPADVVRRQAGLAELEPTAGNGVGVVLGAGNITSIAPLDVLYELYAHNRVTALKLNPIMDALFPVLTKIFEPFIAAGAVRILTGGAEVGGYLVNHDLVQHVHMTGSSITHDAIVWGRGEQAAANKAAGTPLLSKEITSELGGVSPTILLPGRWSKADLRFQAQHVATHRLHNGGYNCIAGQVVVLSADWDQKDAFVAELRRAMAAAPARTPYYPGSDRRVCDAREAYPAAEQIGGRVLISGLTPADRSYLLQTEFFAPVLGIIELPGRDFLDTAIDTANDDFAGTLGINVIAHPRTIKDLGAGFDEALARLRYGSIAVNAWTGVGFLTANASWGAFPGHTIDQVQSGIGVVHNAILLDGPERSIVRGPFRPSPRSLLHGELSISPKPAWFVNNRTAATTGKALVAFASRPSWLRLPRIFASALRG